jgi:hypothetical protein
MKDFAVLIVICALVVFVSAWFLYPAATRRLFKDPIVATRPAEAQSKKDKAERTTKGASLHYTVTMSAAQPVPNQQANPLPPAPPAEPPPAARVPGSNDVKIGEEESDVVAEFGPPALTTSAKEGGHIVQTYIYWNGPIQAVIHLSDGRVSSVGLR